MKYVIGMKGLGLVAVAALMIGVGARADEVSLDDQLKSLELPSNEAPRAEGRTEKLSVEKLYSVQSRYSSLRNRHELILGAGRNFTSDGFISSNELSLGYRFHFTPRWSLGLSGSYALNAMTGAGERMYRANGVVPDAAFTKKRGDLLVGFNLFYGKFRLSMDEVFYFDQYFLLGPGMVEQNLGTSTAAVGEVGIAFWLGRWGSLRMGLRDYYHQEKRLTSTSGVHDVIGSLHLGFFLGKGAGT